MNIVGWLEIGLCRLVLCKMEEGEMLGVIVDLLEIRVDFLGFIVLWFFVNIMFYNFFIY